jgi:hypothetical protein
MARMSLQVAAKGGFGLGQPPRAKVSRALLIKVQLRQKEEERKREHPRSF